MAVEVGVPDESQLAQVIDELAAWQSDAVPMQLHPGDVGWAGKSGPADLARTLRVWRDAGRVVAIGMLDGATVLRLTTAPDLRHDEGLAEAVLAHLGDPDAGVLPAGRVAVEAPNGSHLQQTLSGAGWEPDEPWVALRRDLAAAVEAPGCRIETVGADDPDLVSVQTAVHRGAWEKAGFTDERWYSVAATPAYARARTLLARDEAGEPVATLIVWSAGAGRPGLIEPLGTRPEHRRRGYGRGLCLAAARWLQEVGASSMSVCTMRSLTGAVATYEQSGMVREPDRRDRVRQA